MKVNTYLIVTQYLSSKTSNRRPYKPVVDDEEEEVQVKRQGPYGTKKCGCPFKLKGKQMAMCENWQVFVYDVRHNHTIGVYTHSHTQAAKLTEEQLIQIEHFRKSHVPPVIFYYFFGNKIAQKIYNIVTKIKKNKIQGRNTVEEVLYLSAKRDYTVFDRNCEDSNVLSDIVIAHPISIEMLRTWPYVLIMDITYKTNKECGLMLVIDDVFSTAYHMLCRRHINQNVLAKLTELTKDEEITSWFVNRSWKKLLDEIDKRNT
ncbi:hypothetical protein M9H77_25714 [Catharanthus roseus]|uniref:Uncharacterized protein n=1 Tax=Catharanthus roseus TaxID=4058 RepID=A0ACC0A820_CATRO|nr:hypothetical protein M9H77_25714 [Catharanthus roseus]